MAISPVGLSIVQTDRHRQLAYINIAQRDISKPRNLAVMVSGASRDSQETNSDRAPTHSTQDLLEDKKLLHLYVS